MPKQIQSLPRTGNPLQYPCLGNSMQRSLKGHDRAHHEPWDPSWCILASLSGSFYHFDPTPSAPVKLACLLFFKLDHTLPPWGLSSATPSSYHDLCAKVSSLTLPPSQTVTPWDFSGGPVVKTSPSNASRGGGGRFYPWLGSQDPTCLEAKKPKHKTEMML